MIVYVYFDAVVGADTFKKKQPFYSKITRLEDCSASVEAWAL